MPANRTYFLIESYIKETLSTEEREELWNLLQDKEREEDLIKTLEDYLSSLSPDTAIDKESLQHIWRNAVSIDRDIPQTNVISIRRRWIKWVAAAAIIFAIATTYIVISNQWWRKGPGTIGEKSPSSQDVAPPSNTRAVITLANGSKVYLDSAGNGVLAQENNVNVVRNEKGEIIYSPDHQITPSPIAYNTLYNPRGSKVISLTLSDGTKVWLNSESSLRYPASFAPTAVSREVEITGEAYFEVKHNSRQPFKVHLPDGSIVEDIGTAFNINAYNDEASIKATLIEGLVRVREISPSGRNDGAGVLLKPGQQAVLNQANPKISRIEVQTNVDVDEVMAWKNGLFSFKSADITIVMKQLERWYDLQVVYNATINEKFHVEMSRNTNLSNVFKILEETGGVKFRIEGKKVIVLK